jgi:sugar phosphate isomerase/epimerase
METLDVLIAARAEVEKGWCRFQRVDMDANVCALGAIHVVHGMPREVYSAYSMPWPEVPVEVTDALEAAVPDYFTRVEDVSQPYRFMIANDAATSSAPVLALFDRAIAAEAVKVTADPAHVYAVQA